MMALKLALFDCDGTLADSEYAIVAAMTEAFERCGLPPPDRRAVRSGIGLNVARSVTRLAPQATAAQQDALADAYRDSYFRQRTAAGATPEPLFDGMRTVLETLAGRGWQLGIVTGKSQRGLDRLLRAHGMDHLFATLQTADFHPSKPDPSMVRAALAQTCVDADRCVVIGDTSYDLLMAAAAGVRSIGVTWGAHDAAQLIAAGATHVVDTPDTIASTLELLVGDRT